MLTATSCSWRSWRVLGAQNADTVTRRRRYRERVAQLTAQRSETMEPRSKPSREGSVAQGALALKYIIELSHRVGQVRLQHDPRTYSTMSLVLRVFWLPSVTSLFITPEFQNSNALLAQEWVGGPGGVST